MFVPVKMRLKCEVYMAVNPILDICGDLKGGIVCSQDEWHDMDDLAEGFGVWSLW